MLQNTGAPIKNVPNLTQGKRLKILCAAICVCVAAAACVAIFLILNKPDGLEFEDNATVGILPGIDLDQRAKELQTQLDESVIAYSVNSNPLFTGGSGNLLLENPENNNKLLVAELVLNETNETIYASKAIRPGSYLENVKLDEPVSAGTYEATLFLKAYSMDGQRLIGFTGASLTLTVA